MMKFNIKTGKILLLSIVAFCFVQCNEGDGVAGSGREIAITDSLPGETFDFAVSDITVTPGERSLNITWTVPNNNSEVAYYLVEWQGNQADPTLYSAPAQSTHYTITHLYNDAYKIGVRAISKKLQKSDIVYAIGDFQPIEDNEGPESVSNLTVSPVATSALLSWENPEADDFEYTVIKLKEQGNTEWMYIDTLSALDTEWNITGLSEATDYEYAIQTFDYIGNGSNVTEDEFKTKTEVTLEKVNETGTPNWEIVDFSSEETGGDNGYAANAIDGDDGTFWHSVWYRGNYGDGSSSGTLPQYIVVDLKQTVIPSVISLYRRNGNSGGPTSAKIESTTETPTSKDVQWNDLGTYQGLDGATNNGAININLKVLKESRYIKITILGANNTTYAMIREIDVKALVDEE